jgi:hypothetical protein
VPTVTIQSFVRGAVGSCLRSHQQWKAAYSKDKECELLLALVQKSGNISKDSLKDVHYKFKVDFFSTLLSYRVPCGKYTKQK